jgi:hypothetical protein
MAMTATLTEMRAQLADPNKKVRRRAVAGIQAGGDPAMAPLLFEALRVEPDTKTATSMLRAAHHLGGPAATAALAFGLEQLDLSATWRWSVVQWLGEQADDPTALEALIVALGDESATVRKLAALALAQSSLPRAAEAVSLAFRSGAIEPAKGRGGAVLNPVAVARTIDLFVDDAAVHQVFASHTQPGDTVIAALRLGGFPQVEGGIVAFEDRLVVALRQRQRVFVPEEVNRIIEAPFSDIDEFGRMGLGFGLRVHGETFVIGDEDDFDIANKAQRWLWDQWAPHVARIQAMIEAAKSD